MCPSPDERVNLLDFTLPALIDWMRDELGEPRFRAVQLWQWLWRKMARDFEGMSDISRACRERLAQRARIHWPEVARTQESRDGTVKFLLRMEIGRKGGVHVHLIVPRIRGEDTDLLVQESWKHGRAHFESVHEGGGYEKLAAYLVKQPDGETREQLSLFPEEERKELVKYSSSRNLARPQPERKRYRRRTLRKVLEEGPKASEGYWIDKNTVYAGTNRFTGYSYLRYTECRARTVRSREEWERLKKGGTRDG